MKLRSKILSGIAGATLTFNATTGDVYGQEREIPNYIVEYSKQNEQSLEVTENLKLNPEDKGINLTWNSCNAPYNQARELARKRFVENSWVCLPEREEGLWVETGRNKSLYSVKKRSDLIDTIMENEDKAKFIHIHPTPGKVFPSNKDINNISRTTRKYFFGRELSFSISNDRGDMDLEVVRVMPDSYLDKWNFDAINNKMRDGTDKDVNEIVNKINSEGYLKFEYHPAED